MPLRFSSSGPRRTRPPLTETGILLCCAGLILCPLAGLILTATTGVEIWRALLWLELLLAVCLCLLLWFGVFRPLRILLGELQREENAADARPVPYWIAPCIAPLMRRARNLRDTAERARLAMEERQENLRHTEKLALVGKLAAGVAHSIRNPLTGVKLRLFALTRGLKLDAKQQEDVTAINDALRHVEGIIANFLELSRRPRLEKRRVNISEVIDGTLSLLGPRLSSYTVSLARQRDDQLPPVDADPEQLREALANLVINACEAAGPGGDVRITEEKGRLAPLGHVVVIRVEDSGPGVPEDLREIIFQPFMSTKQEGTGLGLPIARRIFEDHGGWLHLHSAPGRGASFVAVLPARKDDDIWLR